MRAFRSLVHDRTDRRPTAVEGISLEKDITHGRDIGLEGHQIVGLDVELSIGMHTTRDGKRLAAADFHVSGRIHGELKDGNSSKLDLLEHASNDIAWGTSLARI